MTRRINKKTVAMVVFIISTVSKFCGVVHSGKWGLDYTAAVAFDVDDTLKAVWGFILGAVLPIESCGWVRWGILWSSELFSWFLETFIVSVSYNFKLWVFFHQKFTSCGLFIGLVFSLLFLWWFHDWFEQRWKSSSSSFCLTLAVTVVASMIYWHICVEY